MPIRIRFGDLVLRCFKRLSPISTKGKGHRRCRTPIVPGNLLLGWQSSASVVSELLRWFKSRAAERQCRRVPVTARPGEAYLVHRLCLHGVAPWAEDAGEEVRAIAYFRPDPRPGEAPDWWLTEP